MTLGGRLGRGASALKTSMSSCLIERRFGGSAFFFSFGVGSERRRFAEGSGEAVKSTKIGGPMDLVSRLSAFSPVLVGIGR